MFEGGSNYIYVCSGFSVISSHMQNKHGPNPIVANLLQGCYLLIIILIGVNLFDFGVLCDCVGNSACCTGLFELELVFIKS